MSDVSVNNKPTTIEDDNSHVDNGPLASALLKHIKEYYPLKEYHYNAGEIQEMCKGSTGERTQ